MLAVRGACAGSPFRLWASRTRATTPLATPADMLVPLRNNIGCPLAVRPWLVTRFVYRYEWTSLSDASLWPGAITSGLEKPSYQDGPLELYAGTTSSPRVTVLKV